MPGDLYYGDNLEVLRHKVASESVDLVYLDPPFNSDRTYNLIHKASQAQQHAFVDTWHWEDSAERAFAELTGEAPPGVRIPKSLNAMMTTLKEFLWTDQRNMLAYLSMMAIRLVEMRRVLRETGALYLHCDPTASHYLKIILDAVFGSGAFRADIRWKRTSAHGNALKNYAYVSDQILHYTKSQTWTWNQIHQPYDKSYTDSHYGQVDEHGRRFTTRDLTASMQRASSGQIYEWNGVKPVPTRCWSFTIDKMQAFEAAGLLVYGKSGVPRMKLYLDEQPGTPISDLWSDISPVNSQAAERLGYPTQKPLELMNRIVKASSNTGDTVLDPFCGCGTTIEAAEALGRKWIGIDIAIRAIDVIKDRLDEKFQPRTWKEFGEPSDVDGAAHLSEANPYDFQWWSVRKLGAQPPRGEKKKGGDGGIDGEMTLRDFAANTQRRVIVSVKGGHTLTPDMVKGLESTVRLEKADYGILVTMHPPTAGMRTLAREFGTVSGTAQRDGKLEHRIRIITVPEILAGTFRLPGSNVTPRSQSAPPPAEPRVGDNLQLPFPAQSSIKKAKARGAGPGIRSAPAAPEKVLRVADSAKARARKR